MVQTLERFATAPPRGRIMVMVGNPISILSYFQEVTKHRLFWASWIKKITFN